MVSLIHCKVNFLYQANYSYVITIENKLSFNETICETNQITCEYQHNRLSKSKLNSFHVPTYSFIWFRLWESRKSNLFEWLSFLQFITYKKYIILFPLSTLLQGIYFKIIYKICKEWLYK